MVIHIKVKHIRIAGIVYWFLYYWVVNKIYNIVFFETVSGKKPGYENPVEADTFIKRTVKFSPRVSA